MSKLFACYLIDARNDAMRDVSRIEIHREVIKEELSIQDLKGIGEKMLTLHPSCDRFTIMGSGKRNGAKWLYDSANKIPVDFALF